MAAHVSNFKQTNEKIILDLLNEQNGASLPDSAVTFGTPTELVAGEIGTELVVAAASGSGYKGSVTVGYSRVPLSFMRTYESVLVLETEAKTAHGLIDALNTAFGIQLTVDDLVDSALPAVEPNVVVDATISATATSLVWHGPVTLRITTPLVGLSTVLTVTELDGLYSPKDE